MGQIGFKLKAVAEECYLAGLGIVANGVDLLAARYGHAYYYDHLPTICLNAANAFFIS